MSSRHPRRLGAETGVADQAVRAHRLPGQGDPAAGLLDDGGPDVAEHAGQRFLRARAPASRGHVDPRNRLAVHFAAADRPVEQVLEAAGQGARVLGGAEHHRVGLRDLLPQCARGRRQGLAVVVRIERGQAGEALVQHGGHRAGRDRPHGPQRRRVARTAARTARHQQDPRPSRVHSPSRSARPGALDGCGRAAARTGQLCPIPGCSVPGTRGCIPAAGAGPPHPRAVAVSALTVGPHGPSYSAAREVGHPGRDIRA